MNKMCKRGVLNEFQRISGLILLLLFLFVFTAGTVYAGFFKDIDREPTNVWTISSYEKYPTSKKDQFIVDITNAKGYLINYYTKTLTMFPVMTGTSYTPTPVKEWLIKEENIQPNRVVFSDSGEFLRMYMDGTKRTGYGVHGYKYFKREIESGRKYLSLGCVLVADEVLDVIENSFRENDESLKMSTRESVVLMDLLKAFNNADPRFKYNL